MAGRPTREHDAARRLPHWPTCLRFVATRRPSMQVPQRFREQDEELDKIESKKAREAEKVDPKVGTGAGVGTRRPAAKPAAKPLQVRAIAAGWRLRRNRQPACFLSPRGRRPFALCRVRHRGPLRANVCTHMWEAAASARCRGPLPASVCMHVWEAAASASVRHMWCMCMARATSRAARRSWCLRCGVFAWPLRRERKKS